jgi:hypothetical protein
MTTQETIMSADAKRNEDWKYAEKALTWYGWGSPVGVGLFIISIGAFLMLVHYAGIL